MLQGGKRSKRQRHIWRINMSRQEETINKIINMIAELNNNIYESCGEVENLYTMIEYSTDGYSEYITFGGHHIWSDCDDERPYDDDDNQEPLKDFIKREINSIAKTIGKVKL